MNSPITQNIISVTTLQLSGWPPGSQLQSLRGRGRRCPCPILTILFREYYEAALMAISDDLAKCYYYIMGIISVFLSFEYTGIKVCSHTRTNLLSNDYSYTLSWSFICSLKSIHFTSHKLCSHLSSLMTFHLLSHEHWFAPIQALTRPLSIFALTRLWLFIHSIMSIHMLPQ